MTRRSMVHIRGAVGLHLRPYPEAAGLPVLTGDRAVFAATAAALREPAPPAREAAP